jgi:hypothetical protein
MLGTDWLSVLEVHGVSTADLTAAVSGAGQQAVKDGSSDSPNSDGGSSQLLSGGVSSYLSSFLNGGTAVSGKFGSGRVYQTDIVSVLVTDDGRVFLGAVTPKVLEADANAQGSK